MKSSGICFNLYKKKVRCSLYLHATVSFKFNEEHEWSGGRDRPLRIPCTKHLSSIECTVITYLKEQQVSITSCGTHIYSPPHTAFLSRDRGEFIIHRINTTVKNTHFWLIKNSNSSWPCWLTVLSSTNLSFIDSHSICTPDNVPILAIKLPCSYV